MSEVLAVLTITRKDGKVDRQFLDPSLARHVADDLKARPPAWLEKVELIEPKVANR